MSKGLNQGAAWGLSIIASIFLFSGIIALIMSVSRENHQDMIMSGKSSAKKMESMEQEINAEDEDMDSDEEEIKADDHSSVDKPKSQMIAEKKRAIGTIRKENMALVNGPRSIATFALAI